uniref:Uncharacterized protein n=1 Tax=Arundo donax TaxID=35708 RepID=A0A0A9ECU1_ARUDO
MQFMRYFRMFHASASREDTSNSVFSPYQFINHISTLKNRLLSTAKNY